VILKTKPLRVTPKANRARSFSSAFSTWNWMCSSISLALVTGEIGGRWLIGSPVWVFGDLLLLTITMQIVVADVMMVLMTGIHIRLCTGEGRGGIQEARFAQKQIIHPYSNDEAGFRKPGPASTFWPALAGRPDHQRYPQNAEDHQIPAYARIFSLKHPAADRNAGQPNDEARLSLLRHAPETSKNDLPGQGA
jgi:hypothetical protein